MGHALRDAGAGLHLKTAGATWLEELIGLAEGGGDGVAAVKEIYRSAFDQREALCVPYASVIEIDFAKLPHPDAVDSWPAAALADAIRHDQSNPAYDPNVRQLLHVGFKLAAKMGRRYVDLLAEYEPIVSRNVTGNLFERHIRRLWQLALHSHRPVPAEPLCARQSGQAPAAGRTRRSASSQFGLRPQQGSHAPSDRRWRRTARWAITERVNGYSSTINLPRNRRPVSDGM